MVKTVACFRKWSAVMSDLKIERTVSVSNILTNKTLNYETCNVQVTAIKPNTVIIWKVPADISTV